MTKLELKTKLKVLKEKYLNDEQEVMRQFADANNPYKAGDVVEDHLGRLVVTTIDYYLNSYLDPCCIYRGVELCKNGKPKKIQRNRGVYQMNILKEKSE